MCRADWLSGTQRTKTLKLISPRTTAARELHTRDGDRDILVYANASRGGVGGRGVGGGGGGATTTIHVMKRKTRASREGTQDERNSVATCDAM